jgi:hypothetical protein
VNEPVWFAPTVLLLKVKPLNAELVPWAATFAAITEPVTFVPLANEAFNVELLVGAELPTVIVNVVFPPVMIDALAGVAVIAPMTALWIKSNSLVPVMRRKLALGKVPVV